MYIHLGIQSGGRHLRKIYYIISWLQSPSCQHYELVRNRREINFLDFTHGKMTTSAKVAIVSIGEMGLGIAKLLIAHGYTVLTNISSRR